MKTNIYLILMLVLTIGCEDIFENDLTNEIVELVAPSDGLSSDNSTINFWWTLLDSVDYNLKIVSPSFEDLDSLVVDTITKETTLRLSLTPGQYAWKVRAFNNSSYTESEAYTLTITSQ